MKMQLKIVGAGFSCLDIIKQPNGDTFLPGGTCANVLSVLAHFGWDSKLLKPSYSDKCNSYVDIMLKSLGVEIKSFSNSNKYTPRVIQVSNEKGHHFYTACPVCQKTLINLKLPTKSDVSRVKDILNDASVFYYDRISDGITELSSEAKLKGIWTIYEPNSFRGYKVLLGNMLQANIIKFSAERIPMQVASRLKEDLYSLSSNSILIIVTRAEKGIAYAIRESNTFSDWYEIKGESINNIVDSSGAGDWLTAGLINALVGKYPLFSRQLNINVVQNSLVDGQLSSKPSFHSIGALGAIMNNNYKELHFDSATCYYCKI